VAKLTDEQYKEFTALLLDAEEFVTELNNKRRQYGRSVLITESQMDTLRDITDRMTDGLG